MDDVWMLSKEQWVRLETVGSPARAHHCGAVCNDHLLVHSGQDATFLTTHTIHSLNLQSLVWHEIAYPCGPEPRIDAAAAAVKDIGVLILGGVNGGFQFEPSTVWLLQECSGECGVARPVLAPKGQRPHACGSFCAHGLQAFQFGGFDGEGDLDELWCLDLVQCFSVDSAS